MNLDQSKELKNVMDLESKFDVQESILWDPISLSWNLILILL